ncbi:sulfotransferase 1B1-like [Branchiostoma floridae x Branchiostoma japonicum]
MPTSCSSRPVVKIAEFLGRSLTDEQTDEVTANCTFAAMKENLATNYSRDPVLKEKEFKRGNETGIEFIRKGQVGDWRNWFSPQQLEAFEAFDREKMAGTDLTFEDED